MWKRFATLAILAFLSTQPAKAETVRVGVLGPLSGPSDLAGKNFKAGIDAYFALNGNKVGANEIEVVYRDLPEPSLRVQRAPHPPE